MAKAKRMYGCTECGATFPKWAGQCADCGAWNTLVETVVEAAPSGSGRGGWAGQQANLKTLAEVSVEEMPRFTTGSAEAGPGARRRPGGRFGGADRRRSRHRQVDHPPADPVQPGDPGAGFVCHRRGVATAGGDARAAPVAAGRPAQGDDRDQHRDHHRHRPPGAAAGDGDRLDPDHLHRAVAIGAGRRRPGARKRRHAGALRQAERHGDLPGRPRDQGRRAGRATGARAHGRHRAVFRRRVRRPPAPAAGGEEPFRRGQRAWACSA